MTKLANKKNDTSNHRRINMSISKHLRELRDDESGVSVIEFAFVAPFIMTIWLGMVSLLDIESTSTRVGRVSATVADIIAQAPTADTAYINGAFNAGKAMLGNAAAENLELFVAGIEVKANLDVEVLWKCSRNFDSDKLDEAIENIELPDSLKLSPGFIVASHAEYKHTPLLSDIGLPLFGKLVKSGDNTYVYNHYFIPRNSLQTLSDGC